MTSPLDSILVEHHRFQVFLQEHQVHLVEGRREQADRAWAQFRGALLAHIHGEDEVILPTYVARCQPERGGEPEIFNREHLRLRRMLAELTAWLAAWVGCDWPTTEVILLLEREKTLKELLEHHDQREDRYLYATLGVALGEDEASGLGDRFRVACDAAPPDSGAPTGSGPARAALLATGWLAPIYEQVMAGQARPRAEAPWPAAHGRLTRLQAALKAGAGAEKEAAILGELAAILDDVTPMKNFPTALVRDVHACWQLFHAARRAAAARSPTA